MNAWSQLRLEVAVYGEIIRLLNDDELKELRQRLEESDCHLKDEVKKKLNRLIAVRDLPRSM